MPGESMTQIKRKGGKGLYGTYKYDFDTCPATSEAMVDAAYYLACEIGYDFDDACLKYDIYEGLYILTWKGPHGEHDSREKAIAAAKAHIDGEAEAENGR